MDQDRVQKQGDLVVLAHFPTVEEAHMAVAKLEAEGIPAQVEPHGGFDVFQFVFAPKGVAVLVAEGRLDAAKAVLGNEATALD